MLSSTNVTNNKVYSWDVENRLIQVTLNGNKIAEYIYDGDGNRVKKWESSDNNTIIYVNQYHEVNLDTENVTSYYYLGAKLIASLEKNPSQNGTLLYFHQDHLTSTSLMTDKDGKKYGATVKYLPFGDARAAIDIPTDKLFTGQRLDDTGLYFYNARYYDPSIGRFISPDKLIQSEVNPQCFNRYSYCINNPLKYKDPSGHVVEIDGVNITDIDEAVLSGDYMRMCDIYKKVANDINLLIGYGNLRTIRRELANGLEESANTFNIMWKNQGGPGQTAPVSYLIGPDGMQTTYDVEMPNCVKNDPDGITVLLAHEAVHCSVRDKYGPLESGSKYEEATAMQYQADVAHEIGYHSSLATSGIIAFNIWGASHVDLSLESGNSELRLQLNFWMGLSGYIKIPSFASDYVDTFLRTNFGVADP